MEKDIYKTSRLLYIAEAALEYFISLIVSGAFLAKLTTAIGLSDGLTGILSALVSLGCGFQLIAVFLENKRPVKKWVCTLHIINQLFFGFVYFTPFLNLNKTVKTVLFISFLVLAHAINNVVNAPKINWLMSLVDDGKRGTFTANKEIVSLVGGVVFSLSMSAVIDNFELDGNVESAFIVLGVTIFLITILHTLSLLFSQEKQEQKIRTQTAKERLKEVISDKTLFKVMLVSVIWSIAQYSTVPFYGTYQIKELGFSMLFVSLLTTIASLTRALVSRPIGRLGDKHSFVNMVSFCFLLELIAFLINVFTVPRTGKYTYATYSILYALGMAGINSGSINLIYDYVDASRRVSALAIKNTIAGITGFFATLVMSLLVNKIQANGNVFLGMHLYAQQVISFIGAIVVAIGLIYLNTVVKKIQKNRD